LSVLFLKALQFQERYQERVRGSRVDAKPLQSLDPFALSGNALPGQRYVPVSFR